DDAGVGRVHFACAGNADMFTANLDGAAAEEVVTFAPDQDKLDFAARVVLQELLRRFDEVSVETAAETFIGGLPRQGQAFYATIAFALMSAEQRVFVIRRASGRVAQNLHHLLRVGTRGDHTLLRAAEPGRGDHLHRLRDLPHVFDGAHPPSEVL